MQREQANKETAAMIWCAVGNHSRVQKGLNSFMHNRQKNFKKLPLTIWLVCGCQLIKHSAVHFHKRLQHVVHQRHNSPVRQRGRMFQLVFTMGYWLEKPKDSLAWARPPLVYTHTNVYCFPMTRSLMSKLHPNNLSPNLLPLVPPPTNPFLTYT